MVKWLVEEGSVNPLVKDNNGLTPIQIGRLKGHTKVWRVLQEFHQ